jgi:2-polyprenyl-6-methoxyphenol hydroxylase-like FAD-dependent oxidoreductase
MGRIVVCGAGPVGLSAAMMLASDGHDVVVVESDPNHAPQNPEQAWDSWNRRGVAQFRQPHNVFTRFRRICDEELPGLTGQLVAAGCVWVDYLDSFPPTVPDPSPRPSDPEFRLVTGRRPVVESVLAAAASGHSGVTVRRGVQVSGLLTGPPAIEGVPQVSGVQTASGERIRADLVVDATGRRAAGARWIAALGSRPPESESVDRGFAYYTRFFAGPHRPRRIGRPIVPMGSFSLLTLDGDNGTWSVTLIAQAGDAPLKAFRDPACFSRVIGACPMQAHWLDGTPITGVLAMAGVLDRCHQYVVGGIPVVTGFAAVGDAWACTNPSAGRGLSVGMIHAQLLRRCVREHLDAPLDFAIAWDDLTRQGVAPYFRNQVAADRERIAEMTAAQAGSPAPAADSLFGKLTVAASYDAELFRALIETVLCLALPQEIVQRPGLRDKIESLSGLEPIRMPGPDRTELLRLLDRA